MPLAPDTLRHLKRGAITFGAYLLSGIASLSLANSSESVSLLYIAAGFGLAFVLVWGPWMALAIGLGSASISLIAELPHPGLPLSHAQWALAVISGVGGGLQAWLAARWVHPDHRQPLLLEHPSSVATFLLICGPLACLINAVLSSIGMVALGLLPAQDVPEALAGWWAGDTLGVIIGTPMMLTLIAHPTALWKQRRLVVGLPLLAASVLTGLGIRQVQSWEREREAAAFQQQVAATVNAVNLRLNGYLAALESLKGVFEASDSVERGEFKRASHHWLETLKGIQGMGWEERLSIDQLEAFEQQQRQEGVTDYAVYDLPGRTPPKGPDILALRFVEPRVGNERALGFNVLSRDITREAYQRAVLDNTPTATPGFKLAQEPGDQLGVVIYQAVYREQQTLPSDRARNSMGSVFLALRMDDALAAVLKDMPSVMHSCLIDVTDASKHQVLSGAKDCAVLAPVLVEGQPVSQQTSVVLNFGQRQWALKLWAANPMPVVGGRATSWLFAIGGVAFAAALGALLLVITGTTERMAAAIEEARLQRLAAEQANQAKSEFLSRMSHELRTPLNAMLGFAQVMSLDRQMPLPPGQSLRLDQIQQAGWHLLDMIDDVLDLSRIDTGTLRLQVEELNLNEVLDAVRPMIRSLADRHQVQLSIDGSLPAGWGIRADETRLRQVMTNLLSNAIKYNRPGGSVRVQASTVQTEQGPMVNVVVTDNGLGMNASQMAQLFQPFNRLGRERQMPDGTGIGLVISRHLTQLMGGQLEVTSRENEGSTFTVSLPGAALTIPEPAPPAPHDVIAAVDSASTDKAIRHVLYVEDNATNTALVQAALSSRPWIHLSLAATIEEGLASLHDRVRSPLPQLILLDVHLPDASGLDFLKLAKANPETRHIPVVMISADATQEQIEACLAAGAACYLTKPVQIAALLEQVDALLLQD